MSNDGSALATFVVTVKAFFFHHNKTAVVIGVTQVRTSLHFGKGGGGGGGISTKTANEGQFRLNVTISDP